MKAPSYILLALLVGFWIVSTSFSQNLSGKQVDSLISACLRQTGDEKKQTLQVLLDGISVTDPDTVLPIAESTEWIYGYQENYDSALCYYKERLRISLATGKKMV